jgi:hypothetical protein
VAEDLKSVGNISALELVEGQEIAILEVRFAEPQ